MVTSSNRPSFKRVSSLTKTVKVVQLKVELQGVRPKVWRRVLVPLNIRLPLLHVVLLRLMGWNGGHLHEFDFGDAVYGTADPHRIDELLSDVSDESKVSLNKALGGSASFSWLYDYGDAWRHKIKVERVETMPAEFKLEFPVCMTGAGACPPEDVGGAPGYSDFLAAIADSNHPEHGAMTEWIGRPFDPSAFNPEQAQERLYEITL